MDADDWELQVGEETATGLGAGPARSESDTKMQLDSALGDGKKPAVAKPLNGTISTPCRFGLSCTNKFCKFTHPVDAPCRYGVRCFKGEFGTTSRRFSCKRDLNQGIFDRGLPLLPSTWPQSQLDLPPEPPQEQIHQFQPIRSSLSSRSAYQPAEVCG
jgi:hypothetical protein